MHRSLEIAVSSAATDELLEKLSAIEDVISLSVHRGASIKPPGDVISVHALNRGADAVMHAVASSPRGTSLSVATAELSSLNDPEHNAEIDNDVDESLWEEMETGVRHHGRITANFVMLMALGGALATIGLISDRVPQAICLIAASIIAPGFEPIAKIPLGLLLRHPHRWQRGVKSTLVGYSVLIAASAATFAVLMAAGEATHHELIENHHVKMLHHPHLADLLQSGMAAVAGIVMITAYRRSVIAGPLAALAIIPAAALIGTAAVCGDGQFALAGLRRFAIDLVFIIVAGFLILGWKQLGAHRSRRLPFDELKGAS